MQPYSLTRLQKYFFDSRQCVGESIHEYSQVFMAITVVIIIIIILDDN